MFLSNKGFGVEKNNTLDLVLKHKKIDPSESIF